MIQKRDLKQVPPDERVPGKLYWVSDSLQGELDETTFRIFRSGNESTTRWNWNYWFELPESMLPVREVQVMPEVGKEYEFSDDGNYWFKEKLQAFGANAADWTYIRPIQPAPSITIPSGSKSEQIEQLEKILAELKQS